MLHTLDKFEEASEKVKEAVLLETKLVFTVIFSDQTGNKYIWSEKYAVYRSL